MTGMDSRPVQQRVIFAQSTQPPNDPSIIWLDTSTTPQSTKTYDANSGEWVSVGVTDYNELSNAPQNTGDISENSDIDDRPFIAGFDNIIDPVDSTSYDLDPPVVFDGVMVSADSLASNSDFEISVTVGGDTRSFDVVPGETKTSFLNFDRAEYSEISFSFNSDWVNVRDARINRYTPIDHTHEIN